MDSKTKDSLDVIIKSYRGSDTIEDSVSKSLSGDIIQTLNISDKKISVGEYIFHMLRNKKYRNRVMSSSEFRNDLISDLEDIFRVYNIDVNEDGDIPSEIKDRIEELDKSELENIQKETVVEEPVVEEPVVEEPVVEETIEEEIEVEEEIEEVEEEDSKDLSSFFGRKKKTPKRKKPVSRKRPQRRRGR